MQNLKQFSSKNCKNVKLFESTYWKWTIFLQKIIGLWVFQSTWKNYICWCYVFTCTVSLIIPLSFRIYKEIGVNKSIVIENLISQIYLIGVLLKLLLSIIKKEQLKKVYVKIEKTWNAMIDAEEIKVIHKSMAIGYKNAIYYSAFMWLTFSVYITIPLVVSVLDCITTQKNVTRSIRFPIHAEYGISVEKYYYPLLLHFIFAGIPTLLTLVVFDLGFMLLVQNIIALFNLICFRLKKISKLSDAVEDQLFVFKKGDQIIYFHLIDAINLHELVIRYAGLIEDCYSYGWVILALLNTMAISSTLALVLMKVDHFGESIRYTPIVFACCFHFYSTFHTGQIIIDNSLKIFDSCYACKWYNFSNRSTYLVKIMMLRSIKYCKFSGFNLFSLSMNTLAVMMRSVWSIFTIILKKYKSTS